MLIELQHERGGVCLVDSGIHAGNGQAGKDFLGRGSLQRGFDGDGRTVPSNFLHR